MWNGSDPTKMWTVGQLFWFLSITQLENRQQWIAFMVTLIQGMWGNMLDFRRIKEPDIFFTWMEYGSLDVCFHVWNEWMCPSDWTVTCGREVVIGYPEWGCLSSFTLFGNFEVTWMMIKVNDVSFVILTYSVRQRCYWLHDCISDFIGSIWTMQFIFHSTIPEVHVHVK